MNETAGEHAQSYDVGVDLWLICFEKKQSTPIFHSPFAISPLRSTPSHPLQKSFALPADT
jgi:hypothetical protein